MDARVPKGRAANSHCILDNEHSGFFLTFEHPHQLTSTATDAPQKGSARQASYNGAVLPALHALRRTRERCISRNKLPISRFSRALYKILQVKWAFPGNGIKNGGTSQWCRLSSLKVSIDKFHNFTSRRRHDCSALANANIPVLLQLRILSDDYVRHWCKFIIRWNADPDDDVAFVGPNFVLFVVGVEHRPDARIDHTSWASTAAGAMSMDDATRARQIDRISILLCFFVMNAVRRPIEKTQPNKPAPEGLVPGPACRRQLINAVVRPGFFLQNTSGEPLREETQCIKFT